MQTSQFMFNRSELFFITLYTLRNRNGFSPSSTPFEILWIESKLDHWLDFYYRYVTSHDQSNKITLSVCVAFKIVKIATLWFNILKYQIKGYNVGGLNLNISLQGYVKKYLILTNIILTRPPCFYYIIIEVTDIWHLGNIYFSG